MILGGSSTNEPCLYLSFSESCELSEAGFRQNLEGQWRRPGFTSLARHLPTGRKFVKKVLSSEYADAHPHHHI